MDDGILPSNINIESIRNNFKLILHQLSVSSSNNQENGDNSLNSDILSIFQEAASILNGNNINFEIIPDDRTSPINFSKYAILQIEKMSTELDRRTRLFEKSINIAQQIFNNKKDKVQLEFKDQIDKLKQKNRVEEKELNSQLQQLQQSFEARLHTEISKYMKERNLIESQLTKLNSEYRLTETSITTSLTASNMRVQLLEKQRDMLKNTNSQVASTITNKFDQQMNAMQAQYESQIKSIETKNARLSTELKIASDSIESEKVKLKYELENADELHQSRIKSMIDKETLLFEKKKRKITSKHDQIMSDLKHEFEIEEMNSLNEINIINSEIKMLQQLILESDKRYNEMVNDIDNKKNVRLMEIENKIQLLTKIQLKTLKQLEQKHEIDLEKEAHNVTKIRQDLDRQARQNILDAEVAKKKLESQITNIIRSKDIYEEELKKLNSQNINDVESNGVNDNQQKILISKLQKSQPITEISIEPIKLCENSEVEQVIRDNFAKIVEISKYENELIEKASNAIDSCSSIENQMYSLKIEEAQQNINALNDEKEQLQKEIEKIQTDLQNSKSIAAKKQEDSLVNLQNLFESQETIINQLRDDLQNKRLDGAQKVDISVIKEENEVEIEKMRNDLEKLENDLNLEINMIESDYENKIAKEKENLQNAIDKYKTKLTDIQNESEKTKNELKTEFSKNFKNLSETKKNFIESTQKVYQKLASRSGSRPNTSSSLTHSPLPLLKK